MVETLFTRNSFRMGALLGICFEKGGIFLITHAVPIYLVLSIRNRAVKNRENLEDGLETFWIVSTSHSTLRSCGYFSAAGDQRFE